MNRREFVLSAIAASVPSEGSIVTVRGLVKPEALGLCLPHEHLFSMFGADPAPRHTYDETELAAAVTPYVNSLKDLGCRAVADATTAWFGRDVSLLRTISSATGVHLITNTGYYGGADDRYVPRHAYDEEAGQIAARWVREFAEGIDGSGIRPGFIKLGVDAGPVSAIDRKLFEAACIAHRQTGLLLAAHTSGAIEAAEMQLHMLRTNGIAADAWVWIHANNCGDEGALRTAAGTGAWLSFDGIAPESTDRHIQFVSMMKSMGRLNQVLLSHDGNSFRAGGRPMKPYSALFTHFTPALRKAGFTGAEVRRLTVDNPAAAFTVKRRLL